jgi:hypothetical protein
MNKKYRGKCHWVQYDHVFTSTDTGVKKEYFWKGEHASRDLPDTLGTEANTTLPSKNWALEKEVYIMG